MKIEKGFTLLELIIVIVIIGILATLGFTQYGMVVERSRAAEGLSILGLIRKAEIAYQLDNGTYTITMANLPISVPTTCTSTHYFYYTLHSDGSWRVEADRCTSGGKTPNWPSGYCNVIWFDTGALQYNGCAGGGPGG